MLTVITATSFAAFAGMFAINTNDTINLRGLLAHVAIGASIGAVATLLV